MVGKGFGFGVISGQIIGCHKGVTGELPCPCQTRPRASEVQFLRGGEDKDSGPSGMLCSSYISFLIYLNLIFSRDLQVPLPRPPYGINGGERDLSDSSPHSDSVLRTSPLLALLSFPVAPRSIKLQGSDAQGLPHEVNPKSCTVHLTSISVPFHGVKWDRGVSFLLIPSQ